MGWGLSLNCKADVLTVVEKLLESVFPTWIIPSTFSTSPDKYKPWGKPCRLFGILSLVSNSSSYGKCVVSSLRAVVRRLKKPSEMGIQRILSVTVWPDDWVFWKCCQRKTALEPHAEEPSQVFLSTDTAAKLGSIDPQVHITQLKKCCAWHESAQMLETFKSDWWREAADMEIDCFRPRRWIKTSYLN